MIVKGGDHPGEAQTQEDVDCVRAGNVSDGRVSVLGATGSGHTGESIREGCSQSHEGDGSNGLTDVKGASQKVSEFSHNKGHKSNERKGHEECGPSIAVGPWGYEGEDQVPSYGEKVEKALHARNIIQVVTLVVKGGSEADGVLELLSPSGVFLFEQVVEVLVLSFLFLVNLSIIWHDLDKADVLLVNADSLRTRAFKFDLEDQLLDLFFLAIFTTVLVFLFSISGGLVFVLLVIWVVNEQDLDELLSLLMLEFNGVIERHKIVEFLCLVVNFFGHRVGLAVALDVSSSSVFTSELNVGELVHLADSNLALVETDGSGQVFVLDGDFSLSVVALQADALLSD